MPFWSVARMKLTRDESAAVIRAEGITLINVGPSGRHWVCACDWPALLYGHLLIHSHLFQVLDLRCSRFPNLQSDPIRRSSGHHTIGRLHAAAPMGFVHLPLGFDRSVSLPLHASRPYSSAVGISIKVRVPSFALPLLQKRPC